MNSILITGCNRGLGLGLVKVLVQQAKPPKHLFATCRNLEKAAELRELAANNSNVHLLEIDLNNFNSYDNLVAEIAAITKDEGLNVLFNNAGIAPKSVRITGLKEQDMLESLRVNTVVPVMLAKACLPLLKKAAQINESAPLGISRAAIINMSSILGSIAANSDGAMYAYRASKSALNACTKSLSIDLYQSKIMCISLHPGWVKTDMGGARAPLDVETSVSGIVQLLHDLNESHNGGFYQYDGKQLKW